MARARRRSLVVLPLWFAAALAAAAGADASTNTIYTVAGTGTPGFTGDTGPATAAQLSGSQSVSVTSGGGFLIADGNNHRIRRVSTLGIITTVAGSASGPGFAGDNGPATAAQLFNPRGVTATPDGGFLIADSDNDRIRRVSPGGIITTVAGNGSPTFSGDSGPATLAGLDNPQRVGVMPDGGFLITDTSHDRIRRVLPDGTITTVAGDGSSTTGGDGGPATVAGVDAPKDVVATPDGGFLITQQSAQRVRGVSPGGNIDTVAGTGTQGYSGDGGQAVAALLSNPAGVAITPDGGFLIAEFGGRVRRVTPGGTITTLAGGGATTPGDGGPATLATLSAPLGVSVTSEGRVLVAEFNGNRIRFVDTDTRPGPTGPAGPAGPAGQGQTGSQGPTGPAGTPGESGPVRLAAALADDRFRARRGRNLRLRYVVTRSARVTLDVLKGRKRLSRKSASAAAGRNRLSLRVPKQAGRYSLKFSVRSPDGQATTDSARLTVTR